MGLSVLHDSTQNTAYYTQKSTGLHKAVATISLVGGNSLNMAYKGGFELTKRFFNKAPNLYRIPLPDYS